jgi:hypothetical protein
MIAQLKRNIFSKKSAQHAGHVADHFIEVQATRLYHVPSAERQQLPCEAGGPLGGLANLLRGSS